MMAPYFSLADSARVINREIAAQPDAVVACEAAPNTASSLLYYLNARVHWCQRAFREPIRATGARLGAAIIIGTRRNCGRSGFPPPAPVYLIVEEDRLVHWQAALPHPRILCRSGTGWCWPTGRRKNSSA